MKTLSRIHHQQDQNDLELVFQFKNRFQSCTFRIGMTNNEVANRLHELAANIKHDSDLYDVDTPIKEIEFMIGQRVIYYNVICTVCKPENDLFKSGVWIDNPEKGIKHNADISNIKPLPNGQL